jgi:hypothetical protein
VKLAHVTVIGPSIYRLYPAPPTRPGHADPIYDRHARLFGDLGQAILTSLKVGIVGLGGGGSLLNEWLARLGVGHIVAVDFDRVDTTNLPRIVGSTRGDALASLVGQANPWLRRVGKRFAQHKVHVAQRVARQANPSIRFDAVVGDLLDAVVRDCADRDAPGGRLGDVHVVHADAVPHDSGNAVGRPESARADWRELDENGVRRVACQRLGDVFLRPAVLEGELSARRLDEPALDLRAVTEVLICNEDSHAQRSDQSTARPYWPRLPFVKPTALRQRELTASRRAT